MDVESFAVLENKLSSQLFNISGVGKDVAHFQSILWMELIVPLLERWNC